MQIDRRSFLSGLTGLIAAPAIVRAAPLIYPATTVSWAAQGGSISGRWHCEVPSYTQISKGRCKDNYVRPSFRPLKT